MGKLLSDMTLEELWQLFPIILTKPQANWNDWYEEEKELLTNILTINCFQSINHIGSTSIPDIYAKPIIDILIELRPAQDMESIKEILLSNGYLLMNQSKERMSFNKGYTPKGFAEKVYHLHIRYEGDHDELYFRDYLREHPSVAKEYETLKRSLWKEYEHDRDGYTNAKTDFVQLYTQLAKSLYKHRYDEEEE